MLGNINFMNNLNAKQNIEQVNIIFDMFHAVFLNWIPTIPDWNHIPPAAIESRSIAAFKSQLSD